MRALLRFIVPIVSAFFVSMAAGPVKADTFNFAFNNPAVNGGGTVTGTVILNATDTAATSVTVDTNSATPTFGIGQYVGNPRNNHFIVASGQIIVASFLDFGSDNSSGVTCCSLAFSFDTSVPVANAGLENNSSSINQVGGSLYASWEAFNYPHFVLRRSHPTLCQTGETSLST